MYVSSARCWISCVSCGHSTDDITFPDDCQYVTLVVVMCVPSGRPAQQMAGVPRCTVLVGNYYIAFSIHYGGKWGPLSHCCFNGPTSRNVAGIY